MCSMLSLQQISNIFFLFFGVISYNPLIHVALIFGIQYEAKSSTYFFSNVSDPFLGIHPFYSTFLCAYTCTYITLVYLLQLYNLS